MDPMTALLISTAFAATAKKGYEAVGLVAEDWQAFRNGEELASNKRKRIMYELQAELAKQNKDFQSMTATQRARYMKQIGKNPGVGTLVGTQYRNALAAANRKLNSYWDEMERRAIDPDYARRVDEAKAQAKQQARDKWKARSERIKEQGRWVATGASKAATGTEALKDWLREQIPTIQPDPPRETPPEPEPEHGNDPGPEPDPGPEQGPTGGGTEHEEPSTSPGEGFNTDHDPGQDHEPPWMKDYQRARGERADEEWRRRYGVGKTTATDVTPEPAEPAEPQGLTIGPRALEPTPDTHQEGPTAMAKDNNDIAPRDEEDTPASEPAPRGKNGQDQADPGQDNKPVPSKDNKPDSSKGNKPAPSQDTKPAPSKGGAGAGRGAGPGGGAVYTALAQVSKAGDHLGEAVTLMGGAYGQFEAMGARGNALETLNMLRVMISNASNQLTQSGEVLARRVFEVSEVAHKHNDLPNDLRNYRD